MEDYYWISIYLHQQLSIIFCIPYQSSFTIISLSSSSGISISYATRTYQRLNSNIFAFKEFNLCWCCGWWQVSEGVGESPVNIFASNTFRNYLSSLVFWNSIHLEVASAAWPLPDEMNSTRKENVGLMIPFLRFRHSLSSLSSAVSKPLERNSILQELLQPGITWKVGEIKETFSTFQVFPVESRSWPEVYSMQIYLL